MGPPGCKVQPGAAKQSKQSVQLQLWPTGSLGSIYEETTAVNPDPQPTVPPARHQRATKMRPPHFKTEMLASQYSTSTSDQ